MGCQWIFDQQWDTGDGDFACCYSICVSGRRAHAHVLIHYGTQDVKLWRIHSSSAAAVAEEFCSVQPVSRHRRTTSRDCTAVRVLKLGRIYNQPLFLNFNIHIHWRTVTRLYPLLQMWTLPSASYATFDSSKRRIVAGRPLSCTSFTAAF